MLRSLAVASALFLAPLCRGQLLERLPADSTTVLIAGDVLPHVQRLLDAPEVASLFTAIAPLLEEELGMAPDAARLKAQLGLFADFVPVEAAMGLPEATIDSVYYLMMQVLGSATVLVPLAEAEGAEELCTKLRAKVTAGLAGFRGVDGLVAARMRTARIAEQVFELADGALQELSGQGLEVERGDESLSLRIDALQIGRSTMPRMLQRVGVELPVDLSIQLRLQLVLDDDTLVLRLGEPESGPLHPKLLGALWSKEDPPLLFEKTGSGVLRELEEMQDLATEALIADSGGPALSQLLKMWQSLGRFTHLAATGAASLRIDRGLRLDYEEPLEGGRSGVIEPAASIARALDGHSQPCLLLSDSLHSVLAEWFDLLIDPEVDGFERFCGYLGDEDSMLFVGGVALLAGDAQFRGAEALGLDEMPWASLAMVAKGDDEPAAGIFMDEVGACLKADLALDGPAWQAQDLGLGVETFVLDLSKCLPDFAELGVDADFAPHWFVVDEHLVWSTDAKLSRDIVARLRTAAAADAPLPPWEHGRLDGAALRAMLTAGRSWAEAFVGELPPEVDAALAGVEQLFAGVDHVEFDKRPDRKVLRTRVTLRLR